MGFFKKKNTATSPVENSLALEALFAIQDGVIITDQNGLIKFLNPAATTMLGLTSPSDVTNLSYDSALKIAKLDGTAFSGSENFLASAIVNGQPLVGFRALLPSSTPISLSVVIGKDSSRIITFRDIKKELTDEGNKNDFISTASHEMRTPVATIKGYIELCLNPETATIDERARGYLTSAHGASEHLGKLFQDLLDITKLDDGHNRPNFVPVEMVSLVHQITDSFAENFQSAELNLIYGSPNTVTSSPRQLNQLIYGYIDPNFFQMILGNILENAIKYTPAHGTIYVNVMGDENRIFIAVTDTGAGIAPEHLPHIFQKFYRVDNSDTRTVGGTGLGLYLAKTRAEALGGTITAESIVGTGSTFTIILPRLTKDEYDKRMIDKGGII